jgi:hypothetical protein
MPDEVSVRVYQKHKTFHDPLLKDRHLPEALDAISGCQDNQPSQDRRDAATQEEFGTATGARVI